MTKIKYLRKLHNLTVEELAEKLNISKSSLSRFENGERELKQGLLKKLSSFFNVSVDYLLDKDTLNNETISRIEEDSNVPYGQTLENLANALDVSTDYILTDNKKEEINKTILNTPQLSHMNNLKLLRIEKNLTLRDLSEKVNISYVTLSRYENGLQPISEENLVILCNFFDVSADYFLGLSDIKKPDINEVLKNNDFLFALYDQTKDLSDKQKRDVLRIIEVLKDDKDEK